MSTYTRYRDRYHRIFTEANGPGPWPCYGCDQPVLLLLVHHLDENPKNDDPTNLVAMHKGCHNRLHHTGRTRPPETGGRISASKIGKKMPPFSGAHRAALSASIRGKPKNFRKFQCGDCEIVTTGGGMKLHQRFNKHTGKIPV